MNYYWRLFATGFCFFVFGLGGLIVPIVASPVLWLLYRDTEVRKRKSRKLVHRLFKFFVFLLQESGVSRFYIKDYEKLNKLQGHIIMANHPSLIDVVVLISIIPNADCVVKANLFSNPFMKGILNTTGYISNDSTDGLIEDCGKSLENGNNLIIFPEGTRTTPGKDMKFQRGAANIALRCRASVTTVLLKVTPTTLTKSEKWYQIPDRRFEFSLQVPHKEIEFDYMKNAAMSLKSRQFTAALEQHFNEELEKV